jgi:hypothetical protein
MAMPIMYASVVTLLTNVWCVTSCHFVSYDFSVPIYFVVFNFEQCACYVCICSRVLYL